MRAFFLLLLAGSSFCFSEKLPAQPTFNANDQNAAPYAGEFRPGYNPGYYPGWTDQSLSDLAAAIGTRTVRQGLFYELLTTWGYGVRLPEFQHFQSLGMREHIGLILGGANGGSQSAPPDAVRDLTEYCPGHPSELFKGLYEPIWDGGLNGTPVNEKNPFAAFLYQTVLANKDQVRFWEIWNEPGFDYAGKGWRPPGDPAGNWWDANPDPCDYRLHCPIFHYVRLLHIAWEIIKSQSPDSYVCFSSPGYQSFVDAVLRNTDNPADGSVTADYPLRGGAFFDCIAYHSYPHFDGSTVLDPVPPKKYLRNSDQAARGVVIKRDSFQSVLAKRGYDGAHFPKKEFIVSEINIPRKAFSSPYFFGSAEIQRNFIIKASVFAKIDKIHELHFFTLAETKKEANASYEFDLMGLYKNLVGALPGTAVKNDEGWALKTVSNFLYGTTFDAALSKKLEQKEVRVEAFQRVDGKYVIVLWAEALTDMSEAAAATYNFPPNTFLGGDLFQWDFGKTNAKTAYTGGPLALTGSPVFLVASKIVGTSEMPPDSYRDELLAWQLSPNPTAENGAFDLRFSLAQPAQVSAEWSDALGRTGGLFFAKNFESGEQAVPLVLPCAVPGIYFVKLTVNGRVEVRRLVR